MNLKSIKDSMDSYEVVYKDPVSGKQKKETFSSKGAAEDFADNLAAGTFKINKVRDACSKTKRLKDSKGYPETLDEVQDWGLDARTILVAFGSWASQDMLNEFMQYLADELADVTVNFKDYEWDGDGESDYIDHIYEGNDRDVVQCLDKFLDQDQLNEFIGDLDKDYEFSDI